MIFKNLKVSFVPKRLVMVPRSRQCVGSFGVTQSHICTRKPYVFVDQMLSISCGRNSSYISFLKTC